MRFLIDRCAGRRLAEWLQREGHDVLEARELGPDSGDQALLDAGGLRRVLRALGGRRRWRSCTLERVGFPVTEDLLEVIERVSPAPGGAAGATVRD